MQDNEKGLLAGLDMKLVAVSLRYYKCYEATKLIPLCISGNFTGLLGENGAGKSAVLESLSTFFNGANWIRNKTSKKGPEDCGVAPIVMIRKEILSRDFTKSEIASLENLSEKIEKNIDEVTKTSLPEGFIFATCLYSSTKKVKLFDGLSIQSYANDDEDEELAKKVRDLILKSIKFVYLDAEIDIDYHSSLNSKTAEFIKGSEIVSEIAKQLKNVSIKNEKGAKKTISDIINARVLDHIDREIVSKLRNIDPTYDYKNLKQGASSKMTDRRISELAVQALFSNRELTKEKKDGTSIGISDMSSGQRRRVFLDFILVLMKGLTEEQKKKVVLAIDEPEISIDASSRIQQFEKLRELSESGPTILFTTHWYGWIAQLINGETLIVSEKENDRYLFFNTVEKFFETPQPADAPYEMRTMFDFLASLGTWAKMDPKKKFVVCEGTTDKYYIHKHYKDHKIIPTRGCSDVLRYFAGFSNYYHRTGNSPKNVFFLVDTDPANNNIPSDEGGNLKRISKNEKGEIHIVSKGENLNAKCCIEDLLPGTPFLNAMKIAVSVLGKEEKEFIDQVKVVYPDKTGIEAFGLDAEETRKFNNIFKNQYKLKTAMSYNPSSDEQVIFKNLLKL